LNATNKRVPVPPKSEEGCRAIAETLAQIGDKWTVLVVANLSLAEPLRYNELRRSVDGISQRMLTLTLKQLEENGLVKRTLYPTVPPRVDYELTSLGWKLVEPLTALYNWAMENREEMLAARARFAKRSKAHR
jgi:DNA-binding HxlR family transcriptional regulator